MTDTLTPVVTAPTGRGDERLPIVSSGSRSFAWWGTVWLIATEAVLFASLIASYFYLRFRAGPQWPPAPLSPPRLDLPLVMSALLLSSTVPVVVGERAIRAGRVRTMRAALAVAFLLGAAFIALQVGVEYPEVVKDFTPRTNTYGSLFYTLTGLHGTHVVVGLLWSLWVQVRAWTGAFDRHRHTSVQCFALYWHFVDVVWLFVLFTLYLSPRV